MLTFDYQKAMTKYEDAMGTEPFEMVKQGHFEFASKLPGISGADIATRFEAFLNLHTLLTRTVTDIPEEQAHLHELAQETQSHYRMLFRTIGSAPWYEVKPDALSNLLEMTPHYLKQGGHDMVSSFHERMQELPGYLRWGLARLRKPFKGYVDQEQVDALFRFREMIMEFDPSYKHTTKVMSAVHDYLKGLSALETSAELRLVDDIPEIKPEPIRTKPPELTLIVSDQRA